MATLGQRPDSSRGKVRPKRVLLNILVSASLRRPALPGCIVVPEPDVYFFRLDHRVSLHNVLRQEIDNFQASAFRNRIMPGSRGVGIGVLEIVACFCNGI